MEGPEKTHVSQKRRDMGRQCVELRQGHFDSDAQLQRVLAHDDTRLEFCIREEGR